MKRHRAFRLLLLMCLHAAGLIMRPASAQVTVPVSAPAASVLPPLAGAKAVLNHAYQANNLSELNGDLTNESAASIGMTVIFVVSTRNGPTQFSPPKGSLQEAAAEKFQGKITAMLNRYPLSEIKVHAFSGHGTPPQDSGFQGHQFLKEALALSEDYEKTHPDDQEDALSVQLGKNAFPPPSACDFQALSQTLVRIVPRRTPNSLIEAHLEGGQWRLDVGNKWPAAVGPH